MWSRKHPLAFWFSFASLCCAWFTARPRALHPSVRCRPLESSENRSREVPRFRRDPHGQTFPITLIGYWQAVCG